MISGFESFPEARAVLAAGLEEGVYPGCVAGVYQRSFPSRFSLGWGGERRLRAKGLSSQPMTPDTIFDLASVTKVFSTATLALMLVERGWLRWSSPVRDYLPEFRFPDVTIGMLAAHTSGLPAWYPFFTEIRAAFQGDDLESIAISDRQAVMRSLCFQIDLERAPGTKAVYSDIGFLLLGFCLEEALGLPLDRAVERFLWRPMGLYEEAAARGEGGPFYVRTEVAPFRVRNEKAAATEDCPWRKTVLQGQVHDDNCWAIGGYGGHAGAFATVSDVLAFGRQLLERRMVRPHLREAWSRVAVPEGCDRTLGWDTPSGETPALGRFFSKASVGHLGFTGTSFWIDPENGVVVTLLTNRVHPSRDNGLIKAFRGRFHEALSQDLRIQKV